MLQHVEPTRPIDEAQVVTTVLVVEDDPAVRTLLRLLLEDEGLNVREAASTATALEQFRSGEIQLVLLDIRLPGGSGFDVCRQLRTTSAVSIIMLTAQHDSHDVVAGLECGADDYVTKPYNDRELMARIRAQLRRRSLSVDAPSSISVGDVEIRPHEGVVLKRGVELALTKTEFYLLLHLAQSPNRVWSREQLLENVWDYAYAGDGRLVDTHIRRLRMKIESEPHDPVLIHTVRGFGYKLIA